MQLLGPTLSERTGGRKAFILPGVFLQAIMFLPMLAIPFLFHSHQVWWLIAFLTISTGAGAIIGPSWNAMMADLVPTEVRGKYFGIRNRINGVVALVFSFLTGGLLQILTGNTALAFAIILGGAFVSRLLSLHYLSLMYEPHPVISMPAPRESIGQTTRELFSTNIGWFTVFTVFLNMSVNIGSPFFAQYVLEELGMSYFNYQLINAASAVVTLLVVTWWGTRADRAGSAKILRITAWMIPLVPLMWLVSPSVYWIAFAQVYSGFVWAGFNLCAGLYIYDASPQENRARHIALYGALGSGGAMLGSLIGGNLGPHLPPISGSYFLILFVLSGIARLLVVLALLHQISEVREVERVRTADLLFGGIRSSLTGLFKTEGSKDDRPDA